jgi:hypothetical protein
VGGEQPVEPAALGADLVAMARDSRDIVGRPQFGAASSQRCAALRLDEFDAAAIGQRLLCGIDDLYQRAVRA